MTITTYALYSKEIRDEIDAAAEKYVGKYDTESLIQFMLWVRTIRTNSMKLKALIYCDKFDEYLIDIRVFIYGTSLREIKDSFPNKLANTYEEYLFKCKQIKETIHPDWK